MQIDKDTFITKGFPLSPNFLLEHLSTGAYHNVMGKWAPVFSSVIKPNAAMNAPLWKLASNLQIGSQSILEPLLREFGGDLILRSGFNPSTLGKSFDVQVAGFQNNMFNLMPDIQKIARKANSLQLYQGSGSFARINFDEFAISRGALDSLPKMGSVDLLNNLSFNELVPIKGFI